MKDFGVGIAVHSIEEAVEFYTEALGLELKDRYHFPEGHPHCGRLMHAEMGKGDKTFFAIGLLQDYQCGFDPKKQVIGFGAHFHTEAELRATFDALSDGGIVTEPFGTVHSWTPCCATVIDKYGVSWWISL